METVYGIKIEEHEGLTYDIECFSPERVNGKVVSMIHHSVYNVSVDVAGSFLLKLLNANHIPEDTAVLEYRFQDGKFQSYDTHVLSDYKLALQVA